MRWVVWCELGIWVMALSVMMTQMLLRPHPLRWGSPSNARAAESGWIPRWFSSLKPEVIDRASILGIAPKRLALSVVLLLGGYIIFCLVFPPLGIKGLVLIVPAIFVLPRTLVNRRYKRYQLDMQRAFETHVILFRIYFGLGFSLSQSLRLMHTSLRGYAKQEIAHLLDDLTTGRGDAALVDWGSRIGLMEYEVLSSTLVQQHGRALTASTLDPLDTLVTASLEQTMRRGTDKMVSKAAMIPIIATMSTGILYMFGLFSGIPGLSSIGLRLF